MSESSSIAARARVPNPALKPLEFLIGDWETIGSHPALPGKTLSGRTSFAWHEDGAFLIMRAQVSEPKFPHGVAIFASDVDGKFAMSYFDERGTSRLFDVTIGDRTLTWRRNDPELSQAVTIKAVNDTLVSEGRMSQQGGVWTDDLSQVFTRQR